VQRRQLCRGREWRLRGDREGWAEAHRAHRGETAAQLVGLAAEAQRRCQQQLEQHEQRDAATARVADHAQVQRAYWRAVHATPEVRRPNTRYWVAVGADP
jgi:hypothetical protein